MGIILSKFRTKKTTYEVLEKLDNEIKSIEEFKRSTEHTQKKIVGRFILISIFIYLFAALMIYFYFFPKTFYERMLYIVPLIIAPAAILIIKRILTWYYNRKLNKKAKRLSMLKDEKKKKLEEVMDKETYKVATTILEKFAPEQVKKNPFLTESTPIKSNISGNTSIVPKTATSLRYRGQQAQGARYSIGPAPITPFPDTNRRILALTAGSNFDQRTPQLSRSIAPATIPSTPLLLPRAVLPRDRTVFDKMVDYLVGDGPSNRYALICKQCSSHNGMALKEEFEYLSFKCCYCSTFNPSRKKRPIAPKLEEQSQQRRTNKLLLTSSDSEKNSLSTESDTDSDELRVHGEKEENKISDDADVDKLSDLDVLLKNSDNEQVVMQSEQVNQEVEGNKSDEIIENVEIIPTEMMEVEEGEK